MSILGILFCIFVALLVPFPLTPVNLQLPNKTTTTLLFGCQNLGQDTFSKKSKISSSSREAQACDELRIKQHRNSRFILVPKKYILWKHILRTLIGTLFDSQSLTDNKNVEKYQAQLFYVLHFLLMYLKTAQKAV